MFILGTICVYITRENQDNGRNTLATASPSGVYKQPS